MLIDIEGFSVPNSDDTQRELRCAVRFNTANPDYGWLNYIIAVATGSFDPNAGATTFQVFEVSS